MEVELSISGLASGGRGVARHEGQVWFVPGAFPGDVVAAVPRRRRRRFVEARVVRFLRRAPSVREAVCPLQEACGGCPWMTLDEAEQRAWKRRIVRDCLARVGRIPDPSVREIVSPTDALGYRNRIELSLGRDENGEPALGYHVEGSPGVLVDVNACPIQHRAADAVLGSLRRFLFETWEPTERERAAGAGLRVAIRRSGATGELLVVLRQSEAPFPRAAELAERLTGEHPGVVGVVLLESRPGRRGGARSRVLCGADRLAERIAGHRFRLPAATFVQVNTDAASELVGLVVSAAGPVGGIGLLDLYGGIGVYGLAALSAGARAATVCDADRDAIDCGMEAARRAGMRGARFVHADVRRFLDSREAIHGKVDLVLANPPRSGLGPGVAQRMLGLGAGRIVIVSCDPATLARDLRLLIDGGYEPEDVTPVDLFPQTPHIEAVASLRLR